MLELPVIVRDLEIMSGTPCFKGTRVPFQALLDYLEGGETLDEFLEQFPTVSREMAIVALEQAKTLYSPASDENPAGPVCSERLAPQLCRP
jgi:uncharacterized protein (DUF433 family)